MYFPQNLVLQVGRRSLRAPTGYSLLQNHTFDRKGIQLYKKCQKGELWWLCHTSTLPYGCISVAVVAETLLRLPLKLIIFIIRK